MSKADYVRRESAGPAGDHHCHWPGCQAKVPPAMWGCRKHWYALPVHLRNAIWRTFRPGQEQAKNPSPAYIEAARDVQDWIKAHSQNWPSAKPKPVEQATLMDLPVQRNPRPKPEPAARCRFCRTPLRDAGSIAWGVCPPCLDACEPADG